MKISKTQKLVECAVLIALASVLSFIKIAKLPFGGAVTAASMLPMVILSYRHGVKWGLGAGVCYGILQQFLDLGTLSYVTTFQSVVAVILFDYVLAFAGCGLGGIFRGKVQNQASSLSLGVLVACGFRYVCHVISGATVWAGLSIPTEAALLYSLGYNATYMLPEVIVTILVAFYLGSAVNFGAKLPEPWVRKEKGKRAFVFALIGGLFIAVALIYDVVKIFAAFQGDGMFDPAGFDLVPWGEMLLVNNILFVLSAVFAFLTVKYGKE